MRGLPSRRPGWPRLGRRCQPRLPARRRPLCQLVADAAAVRDARRLRATFAGAVLEYTMRAGLTGQGPSTLTECTADGEHAIDLPATSPYAAMIGHVLACLHSHADNLIEPASALPALELTLNVHQRLTQPVS
jgi:hypothetical protein